MEASPRNESALSAGTNRPGRGNAIPTSDDYEAGRGAAQASGKIDADTLRTEIPTAMQEARRWLVWREVPDQDPTKKPRKVPHYANGRTRGATDTPADLEQLVDMEGAIAALGGRPGHYAGPGFALGADGAGGHWQGIDLDHIDTRPELNALAQELPGYQEMSPSGTGVHAIGYGPDFPSLGSNASGIEAYSKGRFFTVTGAANVGNLEDLAPFVLQVLVPKHAPSTGPAAAPGQTTVITPAQVEDLRDALEALKDKADDYGTWIAMGHALYELGAVGFDLWNTWSQNSPRYIAKEARKKWGTFAGERTGYQAVFKAAKRAGWVNPLAGGGQAPDADDEALIQTAIEQARTDPAAMFKPDVLDALAKVKAADPAEYERLRDQAGKTGFKRITELDKQVKPRARRITASARTRSKPNPGAAFGAANPTGIVLDFGEGSLVEWTEEGRASLVAPSIAALKAAPVMGGKFAHCPTHNVWHHFTGTHWEPQPSGEEVKRAVSVAMHSATYPPGYGDRYRDGVLTLVADCQLLPLPPAPPMAIPFRNGLLDPATWQLAPVSPTNALTWCLPYNFDRGADCPTVRDWLLRTVDGDAATVELLRAWLAALLTGRADLQRFLHLPGPGGSGKGAFMRVCAALVGERNMTSTDLRTLEKNNFETAKLYGKRLVLITDSDKYGGSINALKALTGQDPIRLERKHVQQSGTFVFGGLVMLASNEPLATTDLSSGFERRRITVEFNRVASEAEKQAWRDHGGEEAVLHRELPGVVNWALSLSPADVSRIIAHPPQRTQAANLEALTAGNSVADWLVNRCAPDPHAWTQVGIKTEERHFDGSTHYDHADDWLYPSYLAWTLGAGRVPVSLTRFRHAAEDTAKNVLKAHIPNLPRKKEGQGIHGLRLLAKWEQPFDWLAFIAAAGQPAPHSTH